MATDEKATDDSALSEERGVSIPVVNKGDRLATLKFTVCYWESGRLCREEISLRKFQYIAVSHVWGQPKWQTIPGIDGQVLASDAKAKFLTESLPAIVGSDYFWMDILCVDQRDKAARVAVTQYIPDIFRHAQRTVFVKDNRGVQSCCSDAPGNFSTDADLGTLLTEHRAKCHHGQQINEPMLTRLWIFQETLLSNTIQFVNYYSGQRNDPSPALHDNLTSVRFVLKLRELAEAWAGAFAPWKSTPKSAIDEDSIAFMHAFLKNETVRRSGFTILPLHPFPERHAFYQQIFSTRRTSKARDFILATMPQYSFYTVPKNAKEMTFAGLFNDCIYQLWTTGFPMQPLVPRQRMLPLLELSAPEYQFRYEEDPDVEFPNGRSEILQRFPLPELTDLPEPACLGDLVKLFCGARVVFNFDPPLDATTIDLATASDRAAEGPGGPNYHSTILPPNHIHIKIDQPEFWRIISPKVSTFVFLDRVRRVEVTKIDILDNSELIPFLRAVVSKSGLMWTAAVLGELRDTITNTDEPSEGLSHHPTVDERLAAEFLHSWWMGEHNGPSETDSMRWDEFLKSQEASEGQSFVNNVVYLAALITCGLGAAAFEWSKRNLVPVWVSFQDGRAIALIPSMAMGQSCDFWLVGANISERECWTLLARYSGDQPLYTQCVFPWNVDF